MARPTKQEPDMRLPVRPAPAPPKVAVNGTTRKSRPPLQRRITNVGIDWIDPWSETEPTHHATSICHSMSALQISGGQDENKQRKRTPPPRPPPPCFTQTSKIHNSHGPQRATPKPGSSGLLSAIFSSRRPARKPQKDSGNRRPNNVKPHRPPESSRKDEDIVFETCPQKQRQSSRSANHFNKGGTIKKSPPLKNGHSSNPRDNQYKSESPPPLLDLLTSSPPSSPVLSSRFGGSTGADTDSLSSDGFSKVGTGNSFNSAFPLDDDPFDPFGERLNGGASSTDPWAGEDPFTPSPAPRGGHSVGQFEDPWITNSRMSQPDVYCQNPVSSIKANPSTMVTSSSFTFGEQGGWPIPAVRNTTSSSIRNIDLPSSLNNGSSDRNESLSISNPNIRNLNSGNGANSARPSLPCEVPRTMNLAILGAMPTIIRPKPRPKERNRGEAMIASEEIVGSSPPMPSIPPPPPPPDTFLDDWDGSGEAEYPPDLPPRPWKEEQDGVAGENGTDGTSSGTREQPHGVALFDYPATHSDDLPFQTGDVILLIRKINDDWYYGRREAGGPPGMFPSTFVRPVIDLPNENGDDKESTELEGAGIGWRCQDFMEENRMVKALYAFKPEVAADLEFEEGADIEVAAQLDSEWLWGRLGSKWGQFPASFVDRVPRGLPQHHP